MSITVSERTIESWLWDAANILRGPVDASDFKAYVFPLLFLKRISDVHDEERAAALEESGGDAEYADLPEQHRFQIPEGCHWSDLKARTANVGQAIQRAMREIEKGRLNDSAVHERLQELLTSRQAKQARAAELEEQLAALETATAPRPDLSRAAGIVEDVLRGEMEPTKRIFIEAAVASMTIDDLRRVALTLRVPSPGTLVSETSSLVELGGIEPPSIRR
jgi:hypothetical protein